MLKFVMTESIGMKRLLQTTVALLFSTIAASVAGAQESPATQPGAGPLAVPEDARPASTNIVGHAWPKVDSERRVYFRINAPQAQSIRVMGANLTKDENGVWTGVTRPQDPGFHYYTLTIDGVNVADPDSEAYFGAGNAKSGIEIPEQGVDFYDAKDVPHGEIRSRWYMAKTTGQMRQAWIYTPPAYDKDSSARFPVLYLQHGMDEDRRAWSQQGRTNFILDNLIAEGKAKPMIVVMEDGGIVQAANNRGGGRGGFGAGRGRGGGAAAAGGPATQPGATPAATAPAVARGPGGRGFGGGARGGFWDALGPVLINDTIPMIDANYRTIADRDHRAMAGLSLGGTQTYQITQANMDKFGSVGIFSAPFGFPGMAAGYNGLLAKPEEFDKLFKVFFISMGSKEGANSGRAPAEEMKKAGIKHVTYFEAPGTAHEFQTWRKSLYNFAQLIFRD
jgi:enterochelin esterase family protein